MQTGILVFDGEIQDWIIWIDQKGFETFTGMNFEIRIQHRYYKATFEKDYYDWFVIIEDDIDFSLRLVETYKVRIFEKELLPIFDLPF